MALRLGTLNVVFTSDTRDLDRGIARAHKRINELGGSASKTADSLDRTSERTKSVGKESERTAKSIGRMTKNFNTFLRKIRVASAVLGTLLATITALGKEMAQLGALTAAAFVDVQLETARERMESISDSTGQAQQRLNSLMDTASNAGANFLSMGDAMGTAVAALNEAGASFEAARHITSGFVDAMTNLGVGAGDVSNTMSDLAEMAREGEVTMEGLRDAVEFTNDPVRTLSEAFGMSRLEITKLIESERELSLQRLPQLAEQLRNMAGPSDSLTEIFNLLVNETSQLFDVFGRTGVIDAAKSVMVDLAEFLGSDQAMAGIRRFAEGTSRLISETLPNLALATIEHWNTIVVTIKSVAGVLIGSALGGLPGGIIGGLIGGFEQTARVMSIVGMAGRGLAMLFDDVLKPALKDVFDQIEFPNVEKLINTVGRELGQGIAKAQLATNLENARIELVKMQAQQQELAAGTDAYKKLQKEIDKQTQKVRDLRVAFEMAADSADAAENSSDGLKITITEGNKAASEADRTFEKVQKRLAALRGEAEGSKTKFDGLAGSFLDIFLDRRGGIDDLSSKLDRLKTAAENIGEAFASSFTTAVIEGEKLSAVLDSLIKDISRIVLRQTISKPLGKLTTNFASDVLPALFGAGGGTTAPPPMSAARGMAKGGITSGPAIAGEAGPEAVVPLPDGRSIPVRGSSGGTTVVINDMRSSDAPDVEQRETVGPDGKRMLELTIRDVVTDQMNKGEFDKPLRNRFGQRPRTRG